MRMRMRKGGRRKTNADAIVTLFFIFKAKRKNEAVKQGANIEGDELLRNRA